jgi:hypothetical protein
MRFGPASSAGFVMFGAMWMYLAFGFGFVIAFNVLVVAVMAVAARHTEPREKLDAERRRGSSATSARTSREAAAVPPSRPLTPTGGETASGRVAPRR